MARALILLPLIVAFACDVTYAHSFVVYVSTPATPPHGFEWVRAASLASLASVLSLCFSLIARRAIFNSVASAVSATAAFWIAFVFLGRIAATASTAPPPGLGPPSAIYWHWPKGGHLALFVLWNTVGTAILICCAYLIGRLRTLPLCRRLAVCLVLAVTYAICLTPFVTSQAITHGWAGGYVMQAGEEQLRDINRACLQYAADNDGTFPVAQDIEQLIPQISEYLAYKETWYGNPITVHPAAWAFEKEPKAYTWDTHKSGRSAPTLPIWDGAKLPVQCPYIGEARPIFNLSDEQ